MKKTAAILMAVCMLVSMPCVATVPASAAGYSVSVCGLAENGTIWAIGIHDKFEDAWNEAAYYSVNLEEAWNSAERYETEEERANGPKGFVRIIVDFYDDWNADSNGVFGSGFGFKDGVIYVPNGAKITVNLHGHSINRGLAEDPENSKTMHVDAGADIIISNGTIMGNLLTDNRATAAIRNVFVSGNDMTDTNAPTRVASIFGEGSPSMVIAILALVASAVSICLTVVYNKKKSVPATANNAKAEDEES